MKNVLTLALALGLAGAATAQSNDATVTQNGSDNTADVQQANGSMATVTQEGDDSDATVMQSGAAHTAEIYTNSAGAFDGNGKAIARNSATITQIGTGSDFARIRQGAAPSTRVQESSATIFQTGTGSNEAYIDQNIDQSGRQVQSTINQDGFNNRGETVFSANQRQNDVTLIDQTGSNNAAYQLKDDEREGSLTIIQDNSMATTSVGNRAEQYTRKDNARTLRIEQIGDDNDAIQDIYKGSNATTLQYGSGNDAFIYTGSRGDARGFNNTFRIEQGEATLDADDNFARIDADGSDNTASIFQSMGSNNTATISMVGGSNTATATQVGSGNTATIVQN